MAAGRKVQALMPDAYTPDSKVPAHTLGREHPILARTTEIVLKPCLSIRIEELGLSW